jgi:hypothetical protein
MGYKAKICQTYTGTTQTKGRNPKPGNFRTGGFEMLDGIYNV